jgi:hypothetical protein
MNQAVPYWDDEGSLGEDSGGYRDSRINSGISNNRGNSTASGCCAPIHEQYQALYSRFNVDVKLGEQPGAGFQRSNQQVKKAERTLGSESSHAPPILARTKPDSLEDSRLIGTQKANWGNHVQIRLKQELGQSIHQNLFASRNGQSVIQDNQAVETHNLQSSEGPLRKPTKLFGVDVIATPFRKDNEVNARSDDLLALQALGNQQERSLDEEGDTVSSLNSNLEILVSESKTFTNHLLVRCETPASKFQERRREMLEVEHFLDKDFRFSGFGGQFKSLDPGPIRDQWFEGFLKGIWRWHHKGDDLFQERMWQICRFIALYDEELSDKSGRFEEKERCRRAMCSSHVVAGGGVALSSLVPYSLKCERASGPSHVDEGGGDALQGISYSSGDRSSPVQSERFRAGVDRHNVDTISGGFWLK